MSTNDRTSNDKMIERLAALVPEVPEHLRVIALAPVGVEAAEERLERFMVTMGECCEQRLDRGDRVRRRDRTLLRLTNGRRAVAYHASGALEFHGGIEPMADLFEEMSDTRHLTSLVKKAAGRLDAQYWVGRDERLVFERLWRIKAAAADARAKMVSPVLCRAIGAFRHMIGDVPVLGAASMAVQLSGSGAFDVVRMYPRATTNETIDEVEVLSPMEAAARVMQHADRLMAGGAERFADVAEPTGFEFGYYSASKRQAQRVLAPAYTATFRSGGKGEGDESLNHFIVVGAGSRDYLELCQTGRQPFGAQRRAS